MARAIRYIMSARWPLEFVDHGDGTCTIISYGRGDFVDHVGTSCYIIEDEKRIARKVLLADGVVTSMESRDYPKELTIRNPQHIFSYKTSVAR